MALQHDWLQVTLDTNSRRGLADSVEANSPPSDQRVPTSKVLFVSRSMAELSARESSLRMLRSSRDELLLDKGQGELVLAALNVNRQMSALRARLEAFLGQR